MVFGDRTVIRKQPLGTDTDRRLRRETALLERVRGVDGVAQLVDHPRYPDSIVLADAGTTRLADLATPLTVDELLGLAVALARAVAGVHARAVLHRDIAPGNIVLAADGGPTLVDFSLAAPVAELRPGSSRRAEIVGTLAYLAPEATGRTGRPVDHRADHYALGALLYELATGAPPFGAGDPLTLSRDQERQDWLLPTPAGSAPVGTGHETAVPLSVLRYVQRTGEPLVVVDATADDRFARDPHLARADCCSMLVLPILSRGTPRAVLLLENRLIRGAFTTERLDAVRLVAGQLAVSVDNARLYDQLTASRARIVTAADHARRRIERDLHDGVQQQLVALAFRARTAQALAPRDASELLAQLDDLAAEATTALEELRELAGGIHPSILAKGGLGTALNALARRSSVPVQLDVSIPRRLPEELETAAYYLVAEALTNTAKHAHASTATVTVTIAGTEDDSGTVLHVGVRDDGCGGADLTRGTGLIGLADRVEALGGRLVVQSPRGAGATLHAEFPVPDTSPVPDTQRTSG
jgi:signal transduction histidine kinase